MNVELCAFFCTERAPRLEKADWQTLLSRPRYDDVGTTQGGRLQSGDQMMFEDVVYNKLE